ncbi:tricarballylate utilization 4Fe-4S protein TcuB [Campylobacter hyointestinalis]|uniref:tricarballylate utilization 4Fe-4S protein TcuB n=1 Tax=Campylobacter hyointestinalis TaxID=198 RepID=UPI00072794BF|nr:tricarballylate utilization 4Fe-4S protein TcuB [Campylobacter hyointestinalis]PPB55380.1 citrate utilization protein B [Campylobacter hyointestinalis subsp. hyointestinalis]PPB58418.1 citrate utilization protein B [Campylobacter hyointestinalis subsp. hyointestinalis]PPB62392.1 citrate utilization protein B [Campylobacter hyointestinalis subsp. hyointestinalis]PPB63315.1 citrate utilization protein B [Campylobacter hyointestinalis subsp. hyointestinalis]PPB68207.1 citrate utilization prote
MNENEALYNKAIRLSQICNACRYCEGFCAVFPAMEKRREFHIKDADYLANLCHQCGECLYACQYAPPHEFDLDVPRDFAAVRKESYKKFATPKFLGVAFEKAGLLTSVLLLVVLAIFLSLASGSFDKDAAGNFYEITSYKTMVGVFGVFAVISFVMILASCFKFTKSIGFDGVKCVDYISALKDALSLKHLGGHNYEGCTFPNGEDRSNLRRYFHHFTFYGFMLCFAATNIAAFYDHFLDYHAPYAFFSLPKLLGTFGGIALAIGCVGLFAMKIKADPDLLDVKSLNIDYALIFMLFLSAFSGLVLMIFRDTSALACLLVLHLSSILSFFIIAPYSKMMHLFYRYLALVKNAKECRIYS